LCQSTCSVISVATFGRRFVRKCVAPKEEWGRELTAIKERIARQREAIKQAKLRGHSTVAAETIQHTLHQSLRAFEKRRQEVFERLESKREAEEDWTR